MHPDLPRTNEFPWENKCSPWAHRDHGSRAQWPRLRGPMITARLGRSSVTARSQLSHGEVTAQSRLSHGKVTAQSRSRSRLSHGWLWPFWSLWAHREQSRWPIFFSWVKTQHHIWHEKDKCKNSQDTPHPREQAMECFCNFEENFSYYKQVCL